MVNFTNKILEIFFLLLFFSTTVSAAEITARVASNKILVGESFQLFLTAKGHIDKEPDFSELQKKFTILNTSQSSRFRFINGFSSSDKTWVLVLIADDPGRYIIPAINFGKDKSKSFSISIVKNINSNTRGGKQPAEFFLEVNVNPKSVYVQQQFIYTIKIYWQGFISNASMSDLISENDQAIITRFGGDFESNTFINGVNYTILERRFAIFPQKSGTLKLAPLTFKTQFRNQNGRLRSSVKRLRTKAFEIEVKGIPAEFTKKYPNASWLPVEKLSIIDSWSDDIKSFKSGEPMTRTVNLMAQNLTTAQLPDIKFSTPKHIKTYPDVPVVKKQINNAGITARKQFKTAFLPTKVGKYILPKIVIPWWNTKTNSIQESILAAQTITVSAAINDDNDQTLKLNTKDSKSATNENKNENLGNSKLDQNSALKESDQFSLFSISIWIIVSAMLALFWLITIYLLLRLRAKFNSLTVESPEPKSSPTISTKLIKNACKNNDAHACCKILLQWANSKSGSDEFTNLASLYPYTESKLTQAIEELEYYLYGNNSIDWQGGKLWALFKENNPVITTAKRPATKGGSLASLYANYE